MPRKRFLQKRRLTGRNSRDDTVLDESYLSILNYFLFENVYRLSSGRTSLGRYFTERDPWVRSENFHPLRFLSSVASENRSNNFELFSLYSLVDSDCIVANVIHLKIVVSESAAEELIWLNVPGLYFLTDANFKCVRPNVLRKILNKCYIGFSKFHVVRSLERLRYIYSQLNDTEKENVLVENLRREYFYCKMSEYRRLFELYKARHRLAVAFRDGSLTYSSVSNSEPRSTRRLESYEPRACSEPYYWRLALIRRDYPAIRRALVETQPREVGESFLRLGSFYLLSVFRDETAYFDSLYAWLDFALKFKTAYVRRLLTHIFVSNLAKNHSRRAAELLSSLLACHAGRKSRVADSRVTLETYNALIKTIGLENDDAERVTFNLKRAVESILFYSEPHDPSVSRRLETCLQLARGIDDEIFRDEMDCLEIRLVECLRENAFDASAFGLLVYNFPENALIETFIVKHPSHDAVPYWCSLKFKANEIGREFLLEILLNYLDYNCNRSSLLAWTVLNNILEDCRGRVPPELWRYRADWWAKYHSGCKDEKRTRRLKKRALKILASSNEDY